MSAQHVAVVTGASRGIGAEVARQLAERGWAVVLTGRGARVEEACRSVQQALPEAAVVARQLDVRDAEQARKVADFVRERFGRLDALVNNAGGIFDEGGRSTLEQDPSRVLESLDNNTLGALRVSQALVPVMLASGGGNVVNVSSGMGGLAEMGGGHPGYRLSKAALNALTRVLHAELGGVDGRRVRVNAVCPGWVRTDMGGSGATRDVAEGAAGVTWAATLPVDGPSGGFFRDGKPIAW